MDIPETPTEETSPVVFGGYIGEDKEQTAGTRASGLETKNITTFKVFGYKNKSYDAGTDSYGELQKVFPGYDVTWTSNPTATNTNNWEYVNGTSQTIHYWDYSAKAYRYAAYAPANAEAMAKVTKVETATELQFRIHADATTEAATAATPYFSKAWFSNNHYPDYAKYGAPITLTFMQPFSRVRIIFIDEQGKPVTTSSMVFIKTAPGSIQFKPADAGQAIGVRGTVAVSYPLTGTPQSETLTVTAGTAPGDNLAYLSDPYEEASSLAFSTTAQKWHTVLPVGVQGAYEMSLNYNGNLRKALVPATFMDWKPNYQYTYVFKLTDKAMTFESALYVYTKWQVGYVQTPTW